MLNIVPIFSGWDENRVVVFGLFAPVCTERQGAQLAVKPPFVKVTCLSTFQWNGIGPGIVSLPTVLCRMTLPQVSIYKV